MGGNKTKKFKTLKHMLMHFQDNDAAGSSVGGMISQNYGSKTLQ